MSGSSGIISITGSKRTTQQRVEELKESIKLKRNSLLACDAILATLPPNHPNFVAVSSDRDATLADIARAEAELCHALSATHAPGNHR